MEYSIHIEFALVWTTASSDEKDLFLKFVNREIRIFPYENSIFS